MGTLSTKRLNATTQGSQQLSKSFIEAMPFTLEISTNCCHNVDGRFIGIRCEQPREVNSLDIWKANVAQTVQNSGRVLDECSIKNTVGPGAVKFPEPVSKVLGFMTASASVVCNEFVAVI